MSEPRKYPFSDVKMLYGLAAGKCAFPKCRLDVVLDAMPNGERRQIGKIGHIVGHSNDGPRGDSSYSREKLDSYENWILLCPTCHDTVDVQNSIYSVEFLRSLKEDHEAWVKARLAEEMSGVGFPELEVVTAALLTSSNVPSLDFTVVSPVKKMKRNKLTQKVHILLTMGISKSREVSDFIQHVTKVDPDFPERLKMGFSNEYNRLVLEEVLGDALFESMLQYSSGGSQDFKRQAAGLAVLTYLFESCEVFEK